MLVNGNHLTTIWYEDNLDEVKIIDQRLLPHKLALITLTSLSTSMFRY